MRRLLSAAVRGLGWLALWCALVVVFGGLVMGVDVRSMAPDMRLVAPDPPHACPLCGGRVLRLEEVVAPAENLAVWNGSMCVNWLRADRICTRCWHAPSMVDEGVWERTVAVSHAPASFAAALRALPRPPEGIAIVSRRVDVAAGICRERVRLIWDERAPEGYEDRLLDAARRRDLAIERTSYDGLGGRWQQLAASIERPWRARRWLP